MMGKSKRLTTLLIVVAAFLTLAIAGFVAKDAIGESYWLWKLDSDDAGDRSIAAERLGRLRSIRAIPKLIENFRRPTAFYSKDKSAGINALISIGRPAVPALVAAFKQEDNMVRGGAEIVLGRIGPPAVPALLAALKDQDEDFRSSAAVALVLMGQNELLDPEAESVIPALIEALADESARVRAFSASALGNFTPPAIEAVPALARLLEDVDEMVRRNAEDALKRM